MAEAGGTYLGTPQETIDELKVSPGLMTESHLPNLGLTMNIGHRPERGEGFIVRVYKKDTDPRDPDNVVVYEKGLTEEEVIFRMCLLGDCEMRAEAVLDPIAAATRQLMAELGDPRVN